MSDAAYTVFEQQQAERGIHLEQVKGATEGAEHRDSIVGVR